jgi:hypothetical protein
LRPANIAFDDLCAQFEPKEVGQVGIALFHGGDRCLGVSRAGVYLMEYCQTCAIESDGIQTDRLGAEMLACDDALGLQGDYCRQRLLQLIPRFDCARIRHPDVRLAGFMDPIVYVFDREAEARGELIASRPLPYADVDALEPDALKWVIARDHTVEYSHTLEAQIGGQLEAGFLLTHFFEDRDRDAGSQRSRLLPTCYATRAVKRAG